MRNVNESENLIRSLQTSVNETLPGYLEEPRQGISGLGDRLGDLFEPNDHDDRVKRLAVEGEPCSGAKPITPTAPQLGSIALIEAAGFLRECIACGLSAAFRESVERYASTDDFFADARSQTRQLIVFSSANLASVTISKEVASLAQLATGAPIIVLSYRNDQEGARAAFESGAKGFIPYSTGFDLALQAIRFVAAGGTYWPTEWLFPQRVRPSAQPPVVAPAGVTSRQMQVVRAIREGKPNKIIAHELNMCESTVKVHIRHLMTKLHAKNRTEIAIKSAELFNEFPDDELTVPGTATTGPK